MKGLIWLSTLVLTSKKYARELGWTSVLATILSIRVVATVVPVFRRMCERYKLLQKVRLSAPSVIGCAGRQPESKTTFVS